MYFHEQIKQQACIFNEKIETQASMFNERISALEAQLAQPNMERLVSEVVIRNEVQKKEKEILTLKACLQDTTLGITGEGAPAGMGMGADVAAQDLGALAEGPHNQTLGDCDEDRILESSSTGIGPQHFLLTPRTAAPAGDEVLMANCYPSGITAFKKPSGEVVLANHLQIGDEVLTHNGDATTVAAIGHHELRGDFPYALVLISTEQGSFKLSAGCRVAVFGQTSQTIRAGRLRPGDRVKVGAREKRVTKVQDCPERAELIWIRFEPDVSVETLRVTSRGIHTHGEESSALSSQDASWMSVIPQFVLARDRQGSFSDSE